MMPSEKTSESVANFSYPNDWWLDTAQKLFILSDDRNARSNGSPT